MSETCAHCGRPIGEHFRRSTDGTVPCMHWDAVREEPTDLGKQQVERLHGLLRQIERLARRQEYSEIVELIEAELG